MFRVSIHQASFNRVKVAFLLDLNHVLAIHVAQQLPLAIPPVARPFNCQPSLSTGFLNYKQYQCFFLFLLAALPMFPLQSYHFKLRKKVVSLQLWLNTSQSFWCCFCLPFFVSYLFGPFQYLYTYCFQLQILSFNDVCHLVSFFRRKAG